MRIKQICIIALATVVPMLGMSNAANGAGCLAASCNTENTSDPVNSDYANCKTYSDSCYGGNRVRSCKTCIGTLTLTDATISVSGCSNTISYKACKFSGGGTIIGGDDDCEGTCSSSTTYTSIGGSNCKTSSVVGCYGTQKVTTCKTCSSGYTLTSKTMLTLSGCSVSYKTCECTLTCSSDLSLWKLASERGNYESSYKTELNKNTCKCDKIYSYRCRSGYYNSLGSDAVVGFVEGLNCVKCPTALDGSSTSTAGSNAGQGSCYLSKGDSYSHKVPDTSGLKTNTIGKYRLSVDCYYDQAAK